LILAYYKRIISEDAISMVSLRQKMAVNHMTPPFILLSLNKEMACFLQIPPLFGGILC